LDDKHRCKVGEPGFPVAAVERGKKVVVSRDTTFEVADHDYTKTGIIPSVTMICNIPESINGDFYAGKVRIRLKDPIFQPSSLFVMQQNYITYFLKKSSPINLYCVSIRMVDQIIVAHMPVFSSPIFAFFLR